MPGRNANSETYRYQSINGMEKDDEVKGGSGNHLDFGARAYDSRLGKFMSVDAYAGIYPSLSDYAFVANNPIRYIDIDGNQIVDPNGVKVELKFQEDGTLCFGGPGILSPQTETYLNLIAATDIGRKYLKIAQNRHRKYIASVEDKLVLYNAPKAYRNLRNDYKKQFKEGIKSGQYKLGDYTGRDNYFINSGTNSKRFYKFENNAGEKFRAKKVAANTLSIYAGYGIKVPMENVSLLGEGSIQETKKAELAFSKNKNVNILEKPRWNYGYNGDVQVDIAGTFLHELTEALYKNQSETKSREIEKTFHHEFKGGATKKQTLKIESPRL